MSDFSLTTLFVVPVGQTALPSSGSTQDLTAGQVGIFNNVHALATAVNIASTPYFYFAQGRENTYLQGSKRSDKISGLLNAGSKVNVKEWYKVNGVATAQNQISQIGSFSVQCGEEVTLTIRAHSSYLDTLYFNGLTRSVTVKAPCCDCGADPCTDVDVPALIDSLIAKLQEGAPGTNPDNISLTQFFTFTRIGIDATAVLQIEGKPLTAYGQPCDVAAFPHEYDRLWFQTFFYEGPATTADFIVADKCEIVGVSTITQTSTYPTGLSDEIKQLEKDFHSYQAAYLKHLHRMEGYNQNFESYVADGTVYDTFYIKFSELEEGSWGDYVPMDNTVIVAVESGSAAVAAIETVLEAALGTVVAKNA